MADVVFRGTRADLLEKLRRLPGVVAGRLPDPTGSVEGLLMAVGIEVLGKIQDNYVTQSEGGTGELGTGPWAPLAGTTLALRRKETAPKVISRLQAEIKEATPARRKLLAIQYKRLLSVYRGKDQTGIVARKQARSLLELLKPHIAPGRYKKLRGELDSLPKAPKARKLALAGAYSLILRDTGRLLNSLSPQLAGPERILRVAPGAVTVGSNVDYLKYHQSDGPRKKKADGTDRLPRRQVIPDKSHPMPAEWWKAVRGVLERGLQSREFMTRYLSA